MVTAKGTLATLRVGDGYCKGDPGYSEGRNGYWKADPGAGALGDSSRPW